MSILLHRLLTRALAILCAVFLTPWDAWAYAQSGQSQYPESDGAPNNEPSLPPQQLDSLVAPIALFPDPLLAQILAASTYPVQVSESNQWLHAHSRLKGDKLVQEAAKQDWDPSIQALVVFHGVVQQMAQNLPWTTSLGNAFLAQQADVMAAVQRMRQKAYAAGAIPSNTQQTVEIETVRRQSVIVIQPANPQVVYVPSYNPTAVYGPPASNYPYPAIAYPTGAVVSASAISFGVGVALGAAFRGSAGWGWSCDWGPRANITVNNNFLVRYGDTKSMPYGTGAYGSGAWAHNPYYRGAVPYSSAAVAGRYGAAAGVRTPYGTAGAVATSYGSAAGVRTPYGARSAVATPHGSSAGVRTPDVAAGVVAGPNPATAGVRTPNAAAGAVPIPYGRAAGVRAPYGSAVKAPSGTYSSSPYGSADRAARPPSSDWAGSRNFSQADAASRNAFGGTNRGAEWANASSARGFDSMQSRGGGSGDVGRRGGGRR